MDLEHMPTYVPGFRDECNLRDLGGNATPTGMVMRKGLVYRSAALGTFNAAELETLRTFGLRYVLDLRSKKEARKLPDPALPGVEQQRICGAKDRTGRDIDMSFRGLVGLVLTPRRVDSDHEGSFTSALMELYSSIAFDNPAYQELFARLRVGCTPLLFHCSEGKDRTGIAAMLIMCALGYDEEDAVDSYVLTNLYRHDELTALIDGHRKIMSAVPKLRLAAQFGKGVIREFGERVFSEIHQQYGTLEAYYAQEYGLDADGLAEFRARYLVTPEAAEQYQRPGHGTTRG